MEYILLFIFALFILKILTLWDSLVFKWKSRNRIALKLYSISFPNVINSNHIKELSSSYKGVEVNNFIYTIFILEKKIGRLYKKIDGINDDIISLTFSKYVEFLNVEDSFNRYNNNLRILEEKNKIELSNFLKTNDKFIVFEAYCSSKHNPFEKIKTEVNNSFFDSTFPYELNTNSLNSDIMYKSKITQLKFPLFWFNSKYNKMLLGSIFVVFFSSALPFVYAFFQSDKLSLNSPNFILFNTLGYLIVLISGFYLKRIISFFKGTRLRNILSNIYNSQGFNI